MSTERESENTAVAAECTRVLLVEDSPSLSEVYRNFLKVDRYEVACTDTGERALELLREELFEVVLLDLRLPDIDGMEVLRRIHENDIDTSVIIITAHGTVDCAVDAIRLGAADFLTKPFDATRLSVTIKNVLATRRLNHIVADYQSSVERAAFHDFIGVSLPMQTVYRTVENAAPSRATVFITGPSGTGKELCAQAIHKESGRRDRNLVALNCAAIPRDLLESEIFGHVKGAFTGATSNREGAASRADGGTLFLDEVCEMDLDMQTKLLRFIQTGYFQRVGDSKEQKVDIRFVCATNRSPIIEVREGRFREDLFYRLNVIPIEMPPLAERNGDILLIAEELIRSFAKEENKRFRGMSGEVAAAFCDYSWPGNVRELENVLRNIIVLNDADEIARSMLPDYIFGDGSEIEGAVSTAADYVPDPAPFDAASGEEKDGAIQALWLEEKRIIERAIRLCDDNVAKAAALLGVSASTIYRKRMAWEKRSA